MFNSSSPYQKPIADFLQLLTDRGVISPDHQQQAKAITSDFLQQHSDFISIHWDVDDVLGLASDRNLDISPEQALDILDYLENNHDANYGINWQQFSF